MRLKFLAASLLFLSSSLPAVAHGLADTEIHTQQVAPGIAVLSGEGGNIAVSHGPDGTLLIDDEFAPLAGKVLAAVQALGAEPVRFLVNTHWHVDHAGGNEEMGKAGAIIFAQDNVRTRLERGGTVLGNVIAPTAHQGLPIVTFDKGISLHLNGDTIDIIPTVGGHTDGDSAVYWRKANVLHTGDLMMKGKGYPFIDVDSGATADHLITSLDQLIALSNPDTIIIPGHGPLATQAELIAWRGHVADAIATIGRMDAMGETIDAIKADPAVKSLDAPGGFFPVDLFIANVRKSGAAAHHH